ncbi:MAG: folylpolyglutamate synthase/dihydrofolate synthase family protein [Bacteroidota bacterium]
MTYQETIDYLFARLPMYHRIGAAALKPGLDNIIALCSELGDPQENFPTIHIAGTNGKGSTAHFMASILQEAGYKTGLFTSPHLKDFRERIKINGKVIPEKDVIDFVSSNQAAFEQINASFFEYTTAMGFWYFNKEKVDVAIIETGLGGRLDSTNILNPDLCIITSISLDHTQLLGNTVEEIAAEKAGIIKPGIAVVAGPNEDEVISVLLSHALDKQSELILASDQELPADIEPGLYGLYQRENALTAYTAAEYLAAEDWDITDDQIKAGLQNVVKNTAFAGRWQQFGERPLVVCDVAHNEDGIRWIVKQLAEQSFEHLHVVLGMVNDKDISTVLGQLPKDATYYFTNAAIPRALPAEELQKQGADFGLTGNFFSSVSEAFAAAKKSANQEDMIFIGGSVFVVAEIL